ncbi:MAG: putative PEP-binding protein [Leptolyngbyaceae cyanobacterium bins.59]|nr:putative PEP-binding protein [Leptolyngbyaceae cyanobacterium bins.59]
MNKLYWLHEIQPSDRVCVGDKAFYLSQLLQHGYPVISGFVVSSQIWRSFLETIHWFNPLLADFADSALYLNLQKAQQLQSIAQQIREGIVATEIPTDFVAALDTYIQQLSAPVFILRPSLYFPGRSINHRNSQTTGLIEAQFCFSDQADIIISLKQMWAEVFSAKSLTYWQYRGIQLQRINLGVLIQPLFPASVSGKLEADRQQWVIESTWGLGTSLMRGEVVADRYELSPENGTIQTQTLGNKRYAHCIRNTPLDIQEQPLPELSISPCLQTYLLNPSHQQQPSLTQETIDRLVDRIKGLNTLIGDHFTLEWLLSSHPATLTPSLFVTQVNPGLPLSFLEEAPVPLVPSSQTPSSLKVSGLAVASGQVTAPAYVIHHLTEDLNIPAGAILVASSITPDWLPLLRQAVGIITEQGTMTSHSAILARELGIVAIVAAPKATQLIQTGEVILIDGDRGEVHTVQTSNLEPVPANPVVQTLRPPAVPPPTFVIPSGSIGTRLMINLSQTRTLEQANHLPVDGVGLLRSELLLLEVLDGIHPLQWIAEGRQSKLVKRLTELLHQIATTFQPRPVFYRSLDLRSHEFQHLQGSPPPSSRDSALGIRGTFSYVLDPTLFDLELATLMHLYQSRVSNLNLLLPFVRTVEEFRFCRQRAEHIGLTLYPQFQIWMMAEVPSVLFLVPEYVQAGVQGFSIGTNDFTQLLLGVDRDEAQMADHFNALHPAVVRAITHLIDLANQAGIPCSICGQAPVQYPDLIDILVHHGIHSISVETSAIEQTQQAILRAEQRLLLETARSQEQQG